MAKKQKRKPGLPKARHVWRINPKTRVTPSLKKYRRAEEKKQILEDESDFL